MNIINYECEELDCVLTITQTELRDNWLKSFLNQEKKLNIL